MIIMTVVDDHGGISFHNRRQSQDRVLRQRMMEIAGDSGIYMSPYPAKLFSEYANVIHEDEDFLEKAGMGAYCFVEDRAIAPVQEKIEKIILFRWNRAYPADMYFDITLSDGWHVTETHEFAGSSHEKITEEVYEK